MSGIDKASLWFCPKEELRFALPNQAKEPSKSNEKAQNCFSQRISQSELERLQDLKSLSSIRVNNFFRHGESTNKTLISLTLDSPSESETKINAELSHYGSDPANFFLRKVYNLQFDDLDLSKKKIELFVMNEFNQTVKAEQRVIKNCFLFLVSFFNCQIKKQKIWIKMSIDGKVYKSDQAFKLIKIYNPKKHNLPSTEKDTSKKLKQTTQLDPFKDLSDEIFAQGVNAKAETFVSSEDSFPIAKEEAFVEDDFNAWSTFFPQLEFSNESLNPISEKTLTQGFNTKDEDFVCNNEGSTFLAREAEEEAAAFADNVFNREGFFLPQLPKKFSTQNANHMPEELNALFDRYEGELKNSHLYQSSPAHADF